MEYYGYAGKILYVDLTSGKIRTEPLDMEMANEFLGGCGVGERLFYDMLRPSTAPLSPDNPIIIGAGPLVGTLTPQSSKLQLITKSATPANREQSKYAIGWASGGSNRFGIMMKNAGYDQIVITGRASRPVYLKIIDDDVELCDASDLWGKKDLFETSRELMSRYKGSGVIAIGKGGENLVTFALAFVDTMNSIGRNGGATVMGSKNLKAIIAYGSKGIKVWDSKRLIKLSDSISKEIGSIEAEGTTWRLDGEWANLYPVELRQSTSAGERWACANCPRACKDTYKVSTGEFAGAEFHILFFPLLARYGRYLELKDYRHTMKLFDMLNRNGICMVTALAMIRFITTLYGRGVINKKDTDGLKLKSGDIYTYMKLAEKIANREGIGDTMARGWHALCERVGVDEDTYEEGRGVIKGISVIPDVRPRTLEPMIFGTIVSPRGAMHQHPVTFRPNITIDRIKEWCRSLAMSEEMIGRIFTSNNFNCGRLTKHVEDGDAVYAALGVCVTGVYYEIQNLRLLADFYSAVTGIQISPEELKKTGERIWNLYKLLNVREGFDRADDRWPGLWVKSIDGPIKAKTIPGELRFKDYFGGPITHADLERMLDDYYDEHGWDVNRGVPTRKKLTELKLEEFADILGEGA